MENTAENVMVSVFCATYNHKKFIKKTLDGFLMQRCSFSFEIIVGDDHSTDGTHEIVAQYAKKHPNLKLLSAEKNLGATQNVKRIAAVAGGKYVATCDGDDFWTDPLKLQKQVDFLESNPDYVICSHYTKEINVDGSEVFFLDFNPKPLSYTFSDLIVNKQHQTSTVTMVYRNSPEIRQLFSQPWFSDCVACDKFLKLYSTWSTGKKIYVLPETMSCYRRHSGGIWSPQPPIALKKMQLGDFNIIARVFTYTPWQKAKLLFFYLKKYFVFEAKHVNMAKALSTIKAIVA